jgi:predicted alpha/beta hydrolase family esterase
MTRTVLFIQGGGEGTHDEWDNKLVDSLLRELRPGYDIRYPLMPNESDPCYARWRDAIQAELSGLSDGAILVGHSVGGTILINTIAAKPPERTLGGLFLIAAPFIGDGGWPNDEIKPHMNLGAVLPDGVPIFLYHGDDDDTVPIEHVDLYATAIPQAVVRRLQARNHQINDDLIEIAYDIRSLR